MAERTLIGHVNIKRRFKEQERLGVDDDELLEWLQREATVSEGFEALTSTEQAWTLGKIHNLLGK